MKTGKEVSELSHSSVASIAKALKHWASAHKTGGRIDEHFKRERVLVFVLLQGTPDPNDPDNPAKAFRLERAGIAHKADQDFLDENWPVLGSKGGNLTAAMHASLPGPERRAFAGFPPTAFHLGPTGPTSFEHYPVYRLLEDGDGPSYDHPRTEEEKTLCGDVMQLCSWYVNQGLGLRAPRGDHNQPIPDAGSYK